MAANEALLDIAEVIGAPEEEKEPLSACAWVERGRKALDERWEPELKLCLDYDIRTDEPLRARTVAGFAPLVAGGLSPERREEFLGMLDSPTFAGHPRLRWPLPPSTSPEDPGFHPRNYWRGPVWPVVNWLLWWSLIRAGESEHAERLFGLSLEQLDDGGFAEYFDPFTGEALGSANQSWTAAVALDWLASGFQRETQAA